MSGQPINFKGASASYGTIRYSSTNHCPICGSQRADCRKLLRTKFIHCRAGYDYCPPIGYRFVDTDAQGFGMFVHEDDDTAKRHGYGQKKTPVPQAFREIMRREPEKPAHDCAAHAADPAAAAGDRQDRTADLFRKTIHERPPLEGPLKTAFSKDMQLPLVAFNAIPFYAVIAYRRPCMACPLRDGDGRITGLKTRSLNRNTPEGESNKKSMIGSGLVYRDDVATAGDTTTPIFFCEGVSDFMTGFLIGVPMVARDSNNSGAMDIVALVRRHADAIPPDRPLIIMGENDAKIKDGREVWPGKDGAMVVAQIVANRLERPIYVAFPPMVRNKAEAKDVRDWYHKVTQCANPPADLRQEWMDATMVNAVRINPEPHAALPEGRVLAPDPYKTELSRAIGDDGASMETGMNQERMDKLCPFRKGFHHCPNCFKKLRYNERDGMGGFFTFSCRRLSCEVCGDRYRYGWIESVKVRMYQHGRGRVYDPLVNDGYENDGHTDTPAQLYAYEGSASEWNEIIYPHCKSRSGDFIRIDTSGCGYGPFVIVSNVQPPDAFHSEPVTWEEASRRLVFAIEHIPVLRSKCFFSSRYWHLMQEPKKRPEDMRWKDAAGGRYEATEETEDAILAHYRVNARRIRSSSGYPWRARIFAVPKSMNLEHVWWELTEGGPLPRSAPSDVDVSDLDDAACSDPDPDMENRHGYSFEIDVDLSS